MRPRREHRRLCPHCGKRCPGYDAGGGRRLWRARDVGVVCAFIEAEALRVECATHGGVVAAVPWARHASGLTRSFEDTVAWLAVRNDKTTLAGLPKLA